MPSASEKIKLEPGLSGIYMIRNLADGKVYIGSTTKAIECRCHQHRGMLRRGNHCNQHLQRAWNIDGEASFEFCIVVRCAPDECLGLEQYYIDKFQAADDRYGYNLVPVAHSGAPYTDEMRKKLSEAIRAAHARPEVKAKRAAIFNDPEYKAKHAEAMRPVLDSPEYRAKMAESCRAANARPEVKSKISASLKARYETDPGYREKVAAACRGRKHTPETIAKMKASNTPELRAKKRAGGRRPRSAETRAKMSANHNRSPETLRRKAEGAKIGWLKRKARMIQEATSQAAIVEGQLP